MNTPEDTPTNDSAICGTCGNEIKRNETSPSGWMHADLVGARAHRKIVGPSVRELAPTPRPLSHIPTPTVGPQPTAAELDASMLEDLRQWRGRQDDARLDLHGARLTGEEIDMLLRVAAERDDLLAERKAERIGEAVADAFDPYGPPLDFSGHTPGDIAAANDRWARDLARATGASLEDARDFVNAQRPLDFSGHTPPTRRDDLLTVERPACTHAGHTVTEGGATVCSNCGRLLAWVRS